MTAMLATPCVTGGGDQGPYARLPFRAILSRSRSDPALLWPARPLFWLLLHTPSTAISTRRASVASSRSDADAHHRSMARPIPFRAHRPIIIVRI